MPRVYHAPLILGAFAKNLPPARVVFEQIPERMIRLLILQAAEALDGRAGISAIEKLQALGGLARRMQDLCARGCGTEGQSEETRDNAGTHPRAHRSCIRRARPPRAWSFSIAEIPARPS